MTTPDRPSKATRPSRAIYTRRDPKQIWRECDSAYELGYAAAQADHAAGLPAMLETEHQRLWGLGSDYAEGYRDHYAFMVGVTS